MLVYKDNFPLNLINELNYSVAECDFLERYEKVFSAELSERDFKILLLRYRDFLSLGQIAKKYSLSRERIREIIEDSVYLLRRRNIADKIENSDFSALPLTLKPLNLSKRAETILTESGYVYLYEIKDKSIEDFLAIKRIGRQTAREIFYKVQEYKILEKNATPSFEKDIETILKVYNLTRNELISKLKGEK